MPFSSCGLTPAARLRSRFDNPNVYAPVWPECYYKMYSRWSEGHLPMAEERPATTELDGKRTGASYASQWNRFVAWCEESGRSSLPASPNDVAAYLKDRRESEAKPSTLKVVAAAIARSHRESGFDVSAQQGVIRTVLDELTPDDSPSATRELP